MSGRTHTKRFRILNHSVPAARQHVESLLTEWKLDALIETAALITSEFTTNVVQHARGAGEFFELGVRRRDGVLVVEVSDSFQWRMPALCRPAAEDLGGRGLLLVDALADTWGVRPRDPGKTVWAQLRIRREASPLCRT
ncbi:ATP-binding protein [Streptomyces corynorhini]|uniref:ATP-binding protein n=1 Tax=Streptomyces corynorhini TaxID=2282652 RepID=A0A370BG69_9ACTN|nr:ATP-binding protein [Streptomyces corynorhini]RDG38666.1 ATP-binding protein [Streptomyces corynorhini]